MNIVESMSRKKRIDLLSLENRAVLFDTNWFWAWRPNVTKEKVEKISEGRKIRGRRRRIAKGKGTASIDKQRL